MKNSIKNKILRTTCDLAGLEFRLVRKAMRRYRRAYHQGKSNVTGLTHGQRQGWESPSDRFKGMLGNELEGT